jgi:hypothetical protein
VGLGGRDRADVLIEPLGQPAAYVGLGNAADRGEAGCDVPAQEIAVELDRLGPQPWPFRDPGIGVIGERDAAGIGVDPVVLEQLSLGQSQPAGAVGLAEERVRRGRQQSVGCAHAVTGWTVPAAMNPAKAARRVKLHVKLDVKYHV